MSTVYQSIEVGFTALAAVLMLVLSIPFGTLRTCLKQFLVWVMAAFCAIFESLRFDLHERTFELLGIIDAASSQVAKMIAACRGMWHGRDDGTRHSPFAF